MSVSSHADSVLAQLFQSGSNFLTTLAFAHLLSPDEFGGAAIVIVIWMLLLSLNRSVFGEQLLNTSRREKAAGYRDFASLETVILGALTMCLGVLVAGTGLINPILFIVGFVYSDMLRYWTISLPKYERPSLVSTIVFIDGARALLACVAFVLAKVTPAWESISEILAVFGGWVWVLLLARHIRVRPAYALGYLRRRGGFERHMISQFLVLTSLMQFIPLLGAYVYGARIFGEYRLTQTLFAPIGLAATAFQPAFIQYLSGARTGLVSRLKRILLISVSAGAMTLTVLVLTIETWADMFVPREQLDGVLKLTPAVAVAVSLIALGQPASAYIKVLRRGLLSLEGQLAGLMATMVLCAMALSREFIWFAWAITAGSLVTVVTTYYLIMREISKGD